MSKTTTFLDHHQSPIDQADAIFACLPFDGTVSYVDGTSFGPQAILDASLQLEEYEEEFRWEPTNELKLHTLPMLQPLPAESATEYIERSSQRLQEIPREKFVIGIGGEHSVTVPLARRCLSAGDTIISIDAHPDLRDGYLGEHYSHASVMRRLFDDGVRVVELGLRCISKDEVEFAEHHHPNIVQFWMHELTTTHGFDDMLLSLHHLKGNAYLSIDADGLSTAIMPGVGTPIPGGFEWAHTMKILETLFRNEHLNIVGCDVVEVRPLADSPLSQFTAAKLIQKILSYRTKILQERQAAAGAHGHDDPNLQSGASRAPGE